MSNGEYDTTTTTSETTTSGSSTETAGRTSGSGSGYEEQAASLSPDNNSYEASASAQSVQANSHVNDRLGTRGEFTHVASVYFPFDVDSLDSEDQAVLSQVVGAYRGDIAAGEGVEMDVTGYADTTGDEAYNEGLSERRAGEVERYLERATGLDVTSVGLGETGGDPAQSRRADVMVYAPPSAEPEPDVGECIDSDFAPEVDGVNDNVVDWTGAKWAKLATASGLQTVGIVASSAFASILAGVINTLWSIAQLVKAIDMGMENARMIGSCYGTVASALSTGLPSPPKEVEGDVETMRDTKYLLEAYNEAGQTAIAEMEANAAANPDLLLFLVAIESGELSPTDALNMMYQGLLDRYYPEETNRDRKDAEDYLADAWRSNHLTW